MNSNPRELQGGDPSRKLGAKFLNRIQLGNTFPDWEALLGRIEEQRLIADFAIRNRDVLKQQCLNQEHFPQMYDNIYAILGGRGTGKSSVLLTLRQEIHQRNPQDIMLPIITPEIISGRECSILGWIMSSTETVVRKMEYDIMELGRTNPRITQTAWADDFFKNCQFQKKNLLRQRYQELFIRSMDTTNAASATGYSVEDAVYYRMEQSRRQYQLIQDLNTFWEYLSDTWAQVHALQTATASCCREGMTDHRKPLIILTFDDIDLVPERSMELLTTTFQYLTAPNIVIVLTAAEKVLHEVIRLKMAERMIGSESTSLLGDFIAKEELLPTQHFGPAEHENQLAKMAEEFYNKVIPPSSRYYLRRYQSIEERKLYAYSSTKQSFAPSDAKDALFIRDFLTSQIDALLQTLQSAGIPNSVGKKNFLLSTKNSSEFIDAYLLIFGEKNRNIANGCLEIMNAVSRIQTIVTSRPQWTLDKESFGDILSTLRHLLRALLLSNPDLVDFQSWTDRLIHLSLDDHCIFVNYPFVWERYQDERALIQHQLRSETGEQKYYHKRKPLGEAKRKFCTLMVTLFFIEGILGLLDGSKKRILHGYRELSHLLNADAVDLSSIDSASMDYRIFPLHYTVEEFLEQSPLVLEHADRYIGADLFDSQDARAYLTDIFDARGGRAGKTPAEILAAAVSRDREWVKTVLMMLSVCFSGITLADHRLTCISPHTQHTLELFSFGDQFNQNQKVAAWKFLSNRDLIHVYEQYLEEFSQMAALSIENSSLQKLYKRIIPSTQSTVPLDVVVDYLTFLQRSPKHSANIQDQLQTCAIQMWHRFVKQGGDELFKSESPNSLSDSRAELCYQLVRFFRQILDSSLLSIRKDTVISLSTQDIQEILRMLRYMDDYTHALRRQKDTLIGHLNDALFNRKNNSSKAPLDEDDAKSTILLPCGPFIDYLDALQDVVKQQDENYFFDRSDTQTYFDLLKYLRVTEKPKVLPPKDSNSISAEIAVNLKVLEFLMPYYFAASIGISLDSYYRSETLWWQREKGNDSEPANHTVNRLRNLFRSLSSPEEPKQARLRTLRDIMKDTQAELAQQYYNHLEATHE